MTRRNELVGAALRELRVPDHREGFWDDLEASLGARRPPLPRRRGRRLRLALVAAAAVAAALLLGLPRAEPPPPALADVVKQRMLGAVAGLETLRGRAVYRSRHPVRGGYRTQRFRFAATARGDFRLTELGGPADLAYDARRGVERSIAESASLGAGRFSVVRSGLAPGPPDPGPSDWILNRRLGAVVRALLAARELGVRETTRAGRPAWRVVLRVEPNAIAPDYDRIDATIDQATGLPVEVVTTLDGRLYDRLRLRGVQVDAQLARAAFDVPFPRGAVVQESDAGFRRVDLADVAQAVPYAPLVPAAVPRGFRLAAVAVAERAAPTGAEAANPRSRHVVSLTYRRGFDSFTVSTRLTGPDPSAWDDPVAAGEGIREDRERVRLNAGALAGARAELVVGPRSLPHLWAVAGPLVVTVAGDLDGEGLRSVAASLAPRDG